MLFQNSPSPYRKHAGLIVFVLFVVWFLYWAYKIEHTGDKFQPTNQKPVKLFTEDGCTIYRFYDNNLPRYYGKCDLPVSVIWDEKNKVGIGLRMSISTDQN